MNMGIHVYFKSVVFLWLCPVVELLGLMVDLSIYLFLMVDLFLGF